jgi:hypothetical protein
MEKISNKTLSILSLLMIIGILTMPLFYKIGLVLIPSFLCFIGGISFGILIGKNK